MEYEMDQSNDELIKRKIDFAIATNIQKAREQARMTQREVSKAIGVSEGTYSKYENGMVDIPMSKIVKISAVTGVSLEKMVDGEQLAQICVDFKELVRVSMSEREMDNLYRELTSDQPRLYEYMMPTVRVPKTMPAAYGVPDEQDDLMFIEFITAYNNQKRLLRLYLIYELIQSLYDQDEESYARDLARATIKYIANYKSDKDKKKLITEYVIKCKNATVKQ